MAVVMAAHGRFSHPFEPVIGRVSETVAVASPTDTVLVCRSGRVPDVDLSSFAAVLMEGREAEGPRIGAYDDLSHLADGDLVMVDGTNGRTRTLFRRGSPHNALFVTERCNSNCLMCSQPPKDDDGMLGTCHRIIGLLKDQPPVRLGITGGEPTLFGVGFVRLLEHLKADLPNTAITSLSNGRTFADPALVSAIAAVRHPNLRFSIPLHADVPDVHDHIAQARGAFHQTLAGFYNLEAHGIEAEIRVVLHAQSVPRLGQLAEFVWRKLPFVAQVAFMGLEQMGYVKKNWDCLWIDPIDYADGLLAASEHLFRRGVDVSIYNLPLCVLPQAAWGLARKSISDHKQILIEECAGCAVRDHCPGFFTSGTARPSRAISRII